MYLFWVYAGLKLKSTVFSGEGHDGSKCCGPIFPSKCKRDQLLLKKISFVTQWRKKFQTNYLALYKKLRVSNSLLDSLPFVIGYAIQLAFEDKF